MAGVDDGALNGFYQYVVNVGDKINITNALQNDWNATSMDCLEMAWGSGGISNVSASSFTYTAPTAAGGPEVELLRYIPVNNLGERGNITYIFIKILNGKCTGCPVPLSNSLVSNGSFESSAPASTCGPLHHSLYISDVYLNCWTDLSGLGAVTNPTVPKLKVNGVCTAPGGSARPSGTQYINLDATTSTLVDYYPAIQNVLSTPLVAGGSYTLTFWPRFPDGISNTSTNNRLGILATQEPAVPQYLALSFYNIFTHAGFLPLGNNNGVVELTNNLSTGNSTLATTWQQYSINIQIPKDIALTQYKYITIACLSGAFDLDDVSITANSGVANGFSDATSLLAYYNITSGPLTTNNIINIAPTFAVNADLELNHCPNVICAINARINVNSGKTLKITNGTVVKGNCDFWDGIFTTYSFGIPTSSLSHVIIDKSELHDMAYGVNITGLNSMACTDSKFIDNTTSVVFEGTPGSYTDIVEGNEFYRDTKAGNVGIKVVECGNVQVGNLSTGIGNNFHDLLTGISIDHKRSSTTFSNYNSQSWASVPHYCQLYNNSFSNIRGGKRISSFPYTSTVSSDLPGSCIYADWADEAGGALIVKNTNAPGTANLPLFQNSDKGIMIQGPYSAEIRKLEMHNVGWGIVADRVDNLTYTIDNNYIHDAIVGMSFYGNLSTGSTITNNKAWINDITPPAAPAPGAYYGSTGITITGHPGKAGLQSPIYPQLLIKGNEINSATSAGAGISLFGGNTGIIVDHNVIGLTPPAPSGQKFMLSGILSDVTSRSLFSSNTITSPPLYASIYSNVAGIAVSYTVLNAYSCNTIQNMYSGVFVKGNNRTDYSYLRGNNFGHYSKAMFFRHLGTEGSLGNIGSATFDGNNTFAKPYGSYDLYRFCGSFSSIPSNYIYSGTPLTIGSSISCPYLSGFATTTSLQCLTNLVDVSNHVNPQTKVPNVGYARMIANNELTYSEYQAGSRWMEETELFHELSLDSETRATDTALNNFYLANLNSPIGNFDHVNLLIAIADSTADQAAFTAAWQQAWTANNDLQPVSQALQNEQLINRIYLTYKLGGWDTLSAADSSTIAALALQCPLVGGHAVHKARSLYRHYQPLIYFNDFGLCNYPNPADTTNGIFDGEEALLAAGDSSGNGNGYRLAHPAEQAGKSTALKLYPNPTTGKLYIEFSEAGVLEISDLLNRKIRTVTLEKSFNGKTTVDLHGIAPGICICRYLVGGSITAVQKITILHE